MPFVLSGNVGSATAATGFNVDNSCMFNSADSASMEKDAAAPTDNNKWTFSAWVKRSKLGTLQEIFYGEANSTNYCTIRFNDTSDTLTFKNRPGSTTSTLTTSAVFRDPNAWLHLVVVLDTSNGTAANRDIIYINGVRETNFSTESHSGDGDVCYINSDGDAMKISKGNSASFFNGYMAEVYFIDGQALAASDFGEFDEDSPTIWKPKDASGLTFGNNGFYLDFKASGNLGNDANGGTDLTETNLAAVDQATDTCTNNFCTMNPLYNATSSPFTFTQGNCEVEQNTTNWRTAAGTMGVSSGKWYFEAKGGQGTNGYTHYGWSSDSWLTEKGVGSMNEPTTNHNGPAVTYYGYQGNNYYSTASSTGNDTSYGDSWNNDNTIGCFLDLDNNKAYWSKDGTLQNSGTGYSIESGFTWFPIVGGYDMDAGGESVKLNFGGCPATTISSGNTDGEYGNFEYTTTITGDSVSKTFKALCTKNLAEFG